MKTQNLILVAVALACLTVSGFALLGGPKSFLQNKRTLQDDAESNDLGNLTAEAVPVEDNASEEDNETDTTEDENDETVETAEEDNTTEEDWSWLPQCTIEPRSSSDQEFNQEDLDGVISGNTQFGLDVYHLINSTIDNVFFSPLSLSLAMAMVYTGADGDTKSQIGDAFHFNEDTVNLGFQQLLINLKTNAANAGNYNLSIINSMWAQEDISFNDDFSTVLNDNYQTCVRSVNFRDDSENLTTAINAWVANQTNDLVENLIPIGVIDQSTILVLINSLYFKGTWVNQFDDTLTANETFTLFNGIEVQTEMMHRRAANYLYRSTDDYQVIRIPYEGGLSMTVVLPNEDKFEDIAGGWSIDQMNDSFDLSDSQYINLVMPKFELSSQFSAAPLLESMGVTDAFNPSIANFGAMNNDSNLYLSDILHGARIKVDEQGTEAAAATAAVIGLTSVLEEEPMDVRLDHPFLFYIHDDSNTVLFFGQFVQPTDQNDDDGR